ncbi:MAG: polysaccharide biosynthesis protein [Bacteroidetes bacterium]|nr:polysaccharide biosynthesis protein [Bacteroidota bacterium]MBV6461514.1 UDP-N-acetyl-alpha-D-glucosamine C6 dehydratase [Flavobacteriales bacterium]WKZ76491.1 MAG: nucleoside-diphosphate sugar epimerase/dehydratase [Vicingaceae bacterium]MCL4815682.1 polysaccharide biosynthesis protein [Flavobacteriales bacterium]NOG94175.1 polysaccharide biosynthesis protein [Bacteroidota bacterium]
MFFPVGNTPRWIIYFIDIFICLFTLVLAYLLRFNFSIPEVEYKTFSIVFPIVIGVRSLTFLIARTYAGIIRYTSTKDAERIFLTITTGSMLFVIANLISYNSWNERYIIPFSIIVIEFMASTFGLIAFRILVKILYFELKNPSREKQYVLIYGAGESGLIAKRTLDRDAGSKYKVLAFIDDDEKKVGKKLEGIRIEHSSKLESILQKESIAHIIISIQGLSKFKVAEITDLCLHYNTKVLNVPPVTKWINGELSFKQIKKVRIEDLLGREPIKLDENKIKQQLQNKVILITGAAGSIGSEIVRQVAHYNPKKILMLDQAESALYELEFELQEKGLNKICETIIGDVRNYARLENVFKTFCPKVVFHAAAYKHVPLMENNPSESIITNVLGTKNTADLASKYGVETFVMISTDKAVNPTNVMGASKRIAEIYTQSLNEKSDTNFITTRFGNVLGSNGSVIPLFKKQIEHGGPITVTHPEVTRFFMTIPEACQLVLEAGAMGRGGEIFVFDMGHSVKIIDLAKKMIRISGLTLGKDIQIVYTGLRPGEKLYEELLTDKENTIPTHHPQIMIGKVQSYSFEEISKEIEDLIALFNKQNNMDIVGKMKKIVPEFKSKNSVYEKLDEY